MGRVVAVMVDHMLPCLGAWIQYLIHVCKKEASLSTGVGLQCLSSLCLPLLLSLNLYKKERRTNERMNE